MVAGRYLHSSRAKRSQMNDPSERITMETKLFVNPSMVLRREEDDWAILFDPDSGAVRALNLSAVAVWDKLDGQRTLSQIVNALKPLFVDMSPNAAEEVLNLAQTLHQIGAVGICE